MMPIVAIYSKGFTKAAREAEGLTPAQARKILSDAPKDWLPTIRGMLDDPSFKEGMTLEEARKLFPTAIPGDDVAASFLIRIAVGDAGGLVV